METIYFDENGFADGNQIDDSQTNEQTIFDDSKKKLLEKVTNYWNRKEGDCNELTLQRISDFISVNGSHRCMFQCLFCLKKIPCTRKKYWEVGNLQSHLKTHVVHEPVDLESNDLQNQNQQSQRLAASNPSSVNQLSAQQTLNVHAVLNDEN